MKEIVGLVAVRTGSTRLPNKAFRMLNGKPILEVLTDRLAQTDLLDDFIVCTTTAPEDDKILEFCDLKGLKCFRGEKENVLKRFIDASLMVPSQYVVRITGDNPLTDFEAMNASFELMKIENADYSRPVGVPLGTACEIVRRSTLDELLRRTLSPDLTEYMTWFFELAPFVKKSLFKVDPSIHMPHLRLTIDFDEDLEFVNSIIKHFDGRIPVLKDVVSYCKTLDSFPEIKDDSARMVDIKSKIRFI